jgi:glyoxylase-like metal-dependent hydrolase (beta-lactamase superfamily II)
MAAGLLLAMVSSPAISQEVDWTKISLKVSPIAGRVVMIDGTGGFAGGNIAVLAGPDGIVLVDAMFAPLSPKVLATLQSVSAQPVKYIINTHVHGDHTDGNAVLGKGAIVIAHANTRQQLSASGPGPDDKPAPAAAWPVITIKHGLSLHHGDEEIELTHFPQAHSDTDVVVYFKQSKVVHMGDIYLSGMFPYFSEGGSVKGLIASIENVLQKVPADARIIPGHGPVTGTSELRATLQMIRETSAIVEKGIRQKKTLAQMSKANVLARYDKWAAGYLNADQYLGQLYKILRPSARTAQGRG